MTPCLAEMVTIFWTALPAPTPTMEAWAPTLVRTQIHPVARSTANHDPAAINHGPVILARAHPPSKPRRQVSEGRPEMMREVEAAKQREARRLRSRAFARLLPGVERSTTPSEGLRR